MQGRGARTRSSGFSYSDSLVRVGSMSHGRAFSGWSHPLRDLGGLHDVEIKKRLADLRPRSVHPRNDEAMLTKGRDRKSSEAKQSLHSLLLNGHVELAVADERLLAVRRDEMNEDLALEDFGFLLF